MAAPYLHITSRRRTWQGTLEAAVHHYQDEDTGRQVTLVGATSFGDAGYYAQLGELIDEREAGGAVVHCEGPSRVPDDAAIDADEMLLLGDVRDCRDQAIARLPTVGWVHHLAGLAPRPQWQVHDLNDLAIIRLTGAHVMGQQVEQQQLLFDPPKRGLALRMLRLELALELGLQASPATQHRNRPGYDKVVDGRNAVALQAFNNTGRHTVLVWNAVHVPGLDQGIQDAGLRHTGTDWYPVTKLPGLRSLLHKPPSTAAPTHPYRRCVR